MALRAPFFYPARLATDMSTEDSPPAALSDPAVFAVLAEFPKPGNGSAKGDIEPIGDHTLNLAPDFYG